jgi:GNAT superfamily N-acetyltransferase
MAPVASGDALRVRATRISDYAAIRALMRESAAPVPPWSLRQLESQVHAFPEGQMVAVSEGQVVGAAAALVVDWEQYESGHTWRGITGEGLFTSHSPGGRTLYAAALVSDASRHGLGVARALSQAQRRLCRRLNLKRILATARMAGYGARSEAMSAEQYAVRVVWGDIDDPELRLRMAQGFQFCGVLRGYLPEDADSAGCAALLAWLHPLFSPPGPPAVAAPERQRKVA